MTKILPGDFLVKSGANPNDLAPKPLLLSTEGLSFWGGIDPITGIIIDTSHPLKGICVTDTVLCLPSGRGSCTASQVLLELILNDKAPASFVFRDVDGLACVGAIVAQEVFGGKRIPDMVHIGTRAYNELLKAAPSHGCVLANGDFMTGDDSDDWQKEISDWNKTYTPKDDTPKALQFTNEEQALLDSATSEAQRMAYRVLFRYAHLGATTTPPKYVDIAQAHIDGCTYIGPGGLEFTERLVEANGKVLVPTTLNSVSADRRQHQALGVPADYAANSIALGDAYLALGCSPSFTCAPYLLPTEPHLGDDIAWGESNAVVYANSVLGARTEKYADYLDICCALTGKVPATGVHLSEKRKPEVVLDATEMLQELLDTTTNTAEHINLEMLFPTLGHVCGTLSDGKVPVVVGFDNEDWASRVTTDHMKAFCAAFGTTGKSPLVHIAGITPETKQDPTLTSQALQNCPSKTVNWSHCEDTFSLLNNTASGNEGGNKVDLIALGNPHLSVQECGNLAALIQSMTSNSSNPPKKDPNVRILACLSRAIHTQAEEKGYIQPLKDFGVELINDTCWCMLLDAPVIPADPNSTILTNSGKYAHYGPGLTNRRYRYGSTEECVRAAISGVYPSHAARIDSAERSETVPSWLMSPQGQQIRSFGSWQKYRDDGNTIYAFDTTPAVPLAASRATITGTGRSLGQYALRIVRSIARR